MDRKSEEGVGRRRRELQGFERYVARTYLKLQRELEVTKRVIREAERRAEASKREANARRRELVSQQRDLDRIRKAHGYLRSKAPRRRRPAKFLTLFRVKPLTLFSDYLDLMRWADDGGQHID